MFAMGAKNTRKAVSTFAAAAIVMASGLVLDQAHLAAAPKGVVEVGELAPVAEMELVSLPEVVVIAKRDAAPLYAATTQLPEIVVVAKRVAGLMAQDEATRPAVPAINAGH